MALAKMIWVGFLIINFHASGQENKTAFVEKKRTIDSLTLSIDTYKSASVKRVVGADSLFGNYRGLYHYTGNLKKPHKAEYDFETGTQGKKVFYYNDSLIKIVDKETSLYYIDRMLLNDNGFISDTIKSKDLLYFEAQLRKVMLILFDKE